MESSADNNNNNNGQLIVNATTSISSNSPDAEADEEHWIHDYIYRIRKQSAKDMEIIGSTIAETLGETMREQVMGEQMWGLIKEMMEEKQEEMEAEKQRLEEANQHLDLFGAMAFEKKQKDNKGSIRQASDSIVICRVLMAIRHAIHA